MLMLFPDIRSIKGQARGIEGDRICLNHSELEKSMEYPGRSMASTQT